jgi:hypothetical protein
VSAGVRFESIEIGFDWVCLALFYRFGVHNFLFIVLCVNASYIHLSIQQIGFVLHNLVISWFVVNG